MEKAFWSGQSCPREGGSLWECAPLKGTFTDFMQAAFKHRWVTFKHSKDAQGKRKLGLRQSSLYGSEYKKNKDFLDLY